MVAGDVLGCPDQGVDYEDLVFKLLRNEIISFRISLLLSLD